MRMWKGVLVFFLVRIEKVLLLGVEEQGRGEEKEMEGELETGSFLNLSRSQRFPLLWWQIGVVLIRRSRCSRGP